jgi:hypothetical protein
MDSLSSIQSPKKKKRGNRSKKLPADRTWTPCTNFRLDIPISTNEPSTPRRSRRTSVRNLPPRHRESVLVTPPMSTSSDRTHSPRLTRDRKNTDTSKLDLQDFFNFLRCNETLELPEDTVTTQTHSIKADRDLVTTIQIQDDSYHHGYEEAFFLEIHPIFDPPSDTCLNEINIHDKQMHMHLIEDSMISTCRRSQESSSLSTLEDDLDSNMHIQSNVNDLEAFDPNCVLQDWLLPPSLMIPRVDHPLFCFEQLYIE